MTIKEMCIENDKQGKFVVLMSKPIKHIIKIIIIIIIN